MGVSSRGLDYRRAGVDIGTADRLVPRFRKLAARTPQNGVLTGVGPFAAAVRIPASYENPVLLTATDGVGTKLLVAKLAGRHDTIGIDLVAMCVNDLLTTGGRPLCFLDYLATANLANIDARAIVSGVAEGCRLAGSALVGGETAEMPGLYEPGDYDLAGFAAGVVERSDMITGKRVRSGQRLIGLPSSGLHSNGYSLARAALGLGERGRRASATLLEELLEPTRIYVKPVRKALSAFPVTAMAHITGGGLAGNLIRVLPANVSALIDRKTLPRLPLLERIAREGRVARREMERTFNSGIGYVLIVPRRVADEACVFFRRRRIEARIIGELVSGRRGVHLRN